MNGSSAQLPELRRYLVWLALVEDVGIASVYRSADPESAAREYVDELLEVDDPRLDDALYETKSGVIHVATVDERSREPRLVAVTIDGEDILSWSPLRIQREAFAVCWYLSAVGLWGQMARPRDERPVRKGG